MASPERIRQVQEAIMDHLKNIGSHDWEELKKDFLDVPTSSFWRYVKKTKEQLEKPPTPNVITDLFSNKLAGEQQEPWDRRELNGTFRLLKHAQRFYELHADLLALRQHALNGMGGYAIRNFLPKRFACEINCSRMSSMLSKVSA